MTSFIEESFFKKEFNDKDLDCAIPYFTQCLCNLEKFKYWLEKLVKDNPSLFERLKSNEDFLFSLINLRIYEEKFCDAYELIENGNFENPERFVSLWDKAHYKQKEKERGTPLTPLLRFRIRKRFPLPRSVCPSGERPSSNLPEHARETLKQWFNNNASYPYPSEEEKRNLAVHSGLLLTQVNTWFANARRRKKAETSTSKYRYRKIPRNTVYHKCYERLSDNSDSPLDNSMKKVGMYPIGNNIQSETEQTADLRNNLFKDAGNICELQGTMIEKKVQENKEQVYCLENRKSAFRIPGPHEAIKLESNLFDNPYPSLHPANLMPATTTANTYCNTATTTTNNNSYTSNQLQQGVDYIPDGHNFTIDDAFCNNVDIRGFVRGDLNLLSGISSTAVGFYPNEVDLPRNDNPAVPIALFPLPSATIPTEYMAQSSNQTLTTNQTKFYNYKLKTELNGPFVYYDQNPQLIDDVEQPVVIPDETMRAGNMLTELEAVKQFRNLTPLHRSYNTFQTMEDSNLQNIKFSSNLPTPLQRQNGSTFLEYNICLPPPVRDRKHGHTNVLQQGIEEEIAQVLINLSSNVLENPDFEVEI
ncbi:hypothetical protein Ahia01_001257000 [Argonauta hians]